MDTSKDPKLTPQEAFSPLKGTKKRKALEDGISVGH